MMKFTQTIQVELLNYKNDYFLNRKVILANFLLYMDIIF